MGLALKFDCAVATLRVSLRVLSIWSLVILMPEVLMARVMMSSVS